MIDAALEAEVVRARRVVLLAFGVAVRVRGLDQERFPRIGVRGIRFGVSGLGGGDFRGLWFGVCGSGCV